MPGWVTLRTEQRRGRVPPPSSTPAWLQDKPLNTWFEIPGTNITTLVSANGIQTPGGIFEDFNGTALKWDSSEEYAFGGGHGGTWVSTLARIDYKADAPAWSIAAEPVPFANINMITDADAVAGIHTTTEKLWWGTVGNRKPNPPHTYSSGQYVQAWNSMCWFSRFAPYNVSSGAGAGIAQFDIAEGNWVQPEDSRFVAAQPTGVQLGRTCCPDPATGHVYGMGRQTVIRFDPSQPSGSQYTTVLNDNRLNWENFGSAVFDGSRGRVVRIGNAYSDVQMWALRVVPGAGDPVANILPLLNGDAGAISGLLARIQQDTVGACIDPINDRIMIPGAAAGGAFFAVRLTDWRVTIENPPVLSGSAVPGTPTGGGTGLFNRIHYLPQLRAVVMHPRANANVIAMRL